MMHVDGGTAGQSQEIKTLIAESNINVIVIDSKSDRTIAVEESWDYVSNSMYNWYSDLIKSIEEAARVVLSVAAVFAGAKKLIERIFLVAVGRSDRKVLALVWSTINVQTTYNLPYVGL